MAKNKQQFTELSQLFFGTRQLIRSKLPNNKADPNEWMRCEMLRHIRFAKTPPTMRELADYLHVKAPSATSVVIRLEREGFLARVREAKDKRIVRLVLSPKGEKRVARYVADSSRIMEKVFSKISDQDVASLSRILRSVQKAHQG